MPLLSDERLCASPLVSAVGPSATAGRGRLCCESVAAKGLGGSAAPARQAALRAAQVPLLKAVTKARLRLPVRGMAIDGRPVIVSQVK